MLNLDDGKPLAMISSGANKGEIIFLGHEDEDKKYKSKGYNKINLKKDTIIPLLDTDERQNVYIAGPSGSGKSTYASTLAICYKKIFPERDIYMFSRTDVRDDPVYKKLKPMQVALDESLLEHKIDIENDIKKGSLVIFDDCGSIADDKIRKAVNDLIIDILEVGRKLGIWIIITSHLVSPNDRKLARVILNELQSFTFFPRSGSSYQIEYALTKYFGMNKKQIREIMELPSRWVTVHRNYPMCVMYQNGIYML